MLSMASVNRWVYIIGFPLTIAAYIFLLVYDMDQWSDDGRQLIMQEHIRNTKNIDTIDALIVGGSNAVFSLSAEQLGRSTRYTWYNAALLNEGYSDANYHHFIEDMFEKNRRDNIKLVVYSTVYQYRIGEIKQRSEYIGPLYGVNSLSIKPYHSGLYYLTKWFDKDSDVRRDKYPKPNRYGDFVFKKFECGAFPHEDIIFDREDIAQASEALAINMIFYYDEFPNAKLVLVLPPEYYGNRDYKAKAMDYNKRLIVGVLAHVEKRQPLALERISIQEQPLFPSADLLCDARHHGNTKGREWRTRNLATILNNNNK